MATTPAKHPLAVGTEEVEKILEMDLSKKGEVKAWKEKIETLVTDIDRPDFLKGATPEEVKKARNLIGFVLGDENKKRMGGGELKKTRRNLQRIKLALDSVDTEKDVRHNEPPTEESDVIELGDDSILEVIDDGSETKEKEEEEFELIQKFEEQFEKPTVRVLLEVMEGDVEALRNRGYKIDKNQLLSLAQATVSTQMGRLEKFAPNDLEAIRQLIRLGFEPLEIDVVGVTLESLIKKLEGFKKEMTRRMELPKGVPGEKGEKSLSEEEAKHQSDIFSEMIVDDLLRTIFIEENTEEEMIAKLAEQGFRVKSLNQLKKIAREAVAHALEVDLNDEEILQSDAIIEWVKYDTQLELLKKELVNILRREDEKNAKLEKPREQLDDMLNDDDLLRSIFIVASMEEKVDHVNHVELGGKKLKCNASGLVLAVKEALNEQFGFSQWNDEFLESGEAKDWMVKKGVSKEDLKILSSKIAEKLQKIREVVEQPSPKGARSEFKNQPPQNERRSPKEVAVEMAPQTYGEWQMLFDLLHWGRIENYEPAKQKQIRADRLRVLNVKTDKEYDTLREKLRKDADLRSVLFSKEIASASKALERMVGNEWDKEKVLMELKFVIEKIRILTGPVKLVEGQTEKPAQAKKGMDEPQKPAIAVEKGREAEVNFETSVGALERILQRTPAGPERQKYINRISKLISEPNIPELPEIPVLLTAPKPEPKNTPKAPDRAKEVVEMLLNDDSLETLINELEDLRQLVAKREMVLKFGFRHKMFKDAQSFRSVVEKMKANDDPLLRMDSKEKLLEEYVRIALRFNASLFENWDPKSSPKKVAAYFQKKWTEYLNKIKQ